MRKPYPVGCRKVAISKTTAMNCNHSRPQFQAKQQRNPTNRAELKIQCSVFICGPSILSSLAEIVCYLFFAEESCDVKSTSAATLAIVAVANIDPFQISFDGYSKLTARTLRVSNGVFGHGKSPICCISQAALRQWRLSFM